MRASLTFDQDALDQIVKRFEDPVIKQELDQLPMNKAVIAVVAQAIADNFAKEGPGWTPLKPDTIRGSVSKAKYKQLNKMSDQQLLKHEEHARNTGGAPHRSILKRTGLLMKSVTTPGAKGNVWKQEGTNLVWGTDLIYAGIHNHGGVIRPKKAKVLHWSNNTGDHFAKKVTIPARPFLVLRNEWKERLNEVLIMTINKVLKSRLRGAT